MFYFLQTNSPSSPTVSTTTVQSLAKNCWNKQTFYHDSWKREHKWCWNEWHQSYLKSFSFFVLKNIIGEGTSLKNFAILIIWMLFPFGVISNKIIFRSKSIMGDVCHIWSMMNWWFIWMIDMIDKILLIANVILL